MGRLQSHVIQEVDGPSKEGFSPLNDLWKSSVYQWKCFPCCLWLLKCVYLDRGLETGWVGSSLYGRLRAVQWISLGFKMIFHLDVKHGVFFLFVVIFKSIKNPFTCTGFSSHCHGLGHCKMSRTHSDVTGCWSTPVRKSQVRRGTTGGQQKWAFQGMVPTLQTGPQEQLSIGDTRCYWWLTTSVKLYTASHVFF